ncbi:MAG: class C beta-lactamase, partial [Verrucomicrobia bacterium]
IITGVVGAMLTPAFARAQVNIEEVVRQKVQPILPKNGMGGGVAVAVRMDGKTSFFNYGFANNA